MGKLRILLLVVAMVASLLGACSETMQTKNTPKELPITQTPLIRTESILHTSVQLRIYHDRQEQAMEEAFAYMAEMEQLFSASIASSNVAQINQHAGKQAVVVQQETIDVIKKALEYSQRTQGKFDITIGSLNQLWGIGTQDAHVPSNDDVQAAVDLIDYRQVEIDETNKTIFLKRADMQIELGAISKGYIADGVKKIFERHGITTAVINLGGNVIVMGHSPSEKDGWNVGVQDPDQARGKVVGSVLLSDESIVTSGIYERYFEVDGTRYHHILDPHTGFPVENDISGVSIFSPHSIDGDALSTSVFLLGSVEGMEFIRSLEGIEAIFILKDRSVIVSDGLNGQFKITNEEYHIANE